jgi:hypothetical protein
MYIQYIQDLFQSRLGTVDYALVTSSLHYNDSLLNMCRRIFGPKILDHLCGLLVRVPGYTTEMYCASCEVKIEYICYVEESRPPLLFRGQSSWLQIQRSLVLFPALPDFLRSSESGTRSTQPREYNLEAT